MNFQHRVATVLTPAALLVGVTAAGSLRLVTTTEDLAAIAREIGGDRVAVRSICRGWEDPHSVQGRPSFVLAARDADLWIRVGLDLEAGWEPAVLENARNPRILPGRPGHLDAATLIEPLDVATGRLSRSAGHVHPAGNPHYWTDPWNGRLLARGIAERLTRLDPTGATNYTARLADFERRLDTAMFGSQLLTRLTGDEAWAAQRAGELDSRAASLGLSPGGWYAAMRPFRGTRLLTYHRSWTYFAHRFGLHIAGEIEPQPGVPPSGAWLDSLAERARAAGVRFILQEPHYSDRAARRLARDTGARVVIAPISVGGAPEVSGYIALLDEIVRRICEARR
ncbi:MAG: metal ABC transporter substrate-binding protein [Kiritimatiellae bacterium]|nr:metal ABC transporter substrate-binding protein [Kiritimatiellia bacterium]